MSKVKTLLTVPQIDMLIDVACRMQADDIWDDYTIQQNETLDRAVKALCQAKNDAKQ